MKDKRAVFFDSNILVYLLPGDKRKGDIAERLLLSDREERHVSTQVIGEFADVARRKAKLDWQEIRRHVETFRDLCAVERISDIDQDLAMDIAERYRLRWWDSQIIAVALRVGAEVLYSEDMQDRLRIEFLEIHNPFAR